MKQLPQVKGELLHSNDACEVMNETFPLDCLAVQAPITSGSSVADRGDGYGRRGPHTQHTTHNTQETHMSRTITVEHDGKTYQGEVAKITRTQLGSEDHGIFTAYLFLEGPGWGQALGGYSLDFWSENDRRRRGTAFGMDHIMSIIATVSASSWEDLTRHSIVVLRLDSGIIGGFQSLDGARTLIFEDHAKQYNSKSGAEVAS